MLGCHKNKDAQSMPRIVSDGSNMCGKFLSILASRYAYVSDQPQGDNAFFSDELVANM